MAVPVPEVESRVAVSVEALGVGLEVCEVVLASPVIELPLTELEEESGFEA